MGVRGTLCGEMLWVGSEEHPLGPELLGKGGDRLGPVRVAGQE